MPQTNLQAIGNHFNVQRTVLYSETAGTLLSDFYS